MEHLSHLTVKALLKIISFKQMAYVQMTVVMANLLIKKKENVEFVIKNLAA